MHDLLQYAFGVLHIATLVNDSRKMIVNATLSNNRVGIAIILDAANISSNYVDPEVSRYFHGHFLCLSTTAISATTTTDLFS